MLSRLLFHPKAILLRAGFAIDRLYHKPKLAMHRPKRTTVKNNILILTTLLLAPLHELWSISQSRGCVPIYLNQNEDV
jgi:hypothetical protein